MGNEQPVWDGLFLSFLFLFLFFFNRARTLIYCCNGFLFLSLVSMMMCFCNDWAGIETLSLRDE